MNRYVFSSHTHLPHIKFCRACGNSSAFCRCVTDLLKDLMYKDMIKQMQISYVGSTGSILPLQP